MKKQTEVVAALIWDGGRFMICQRPAHKAVSYTHLTLPTNREV